MTRVFLADADVPYALQLDMRGSHVIDHGQTLDSCLHMIKLSSNTQFKRQSEHMNLRFWNEESEQNIHTHNTLRHKS